MHSPRGEGSIMFYISCHNILIACPHCKQHTSDDLDRGKPLIMQAAPAHKA